MTTNNQYVQGSAKIIKSKVKIKHFSTVGLQAEFGLKSGLTLTFVGLGLGLGPTGLRLGLWSNGLGLELWSNGLGLTPDGL